MRPQSGQDDGDGTVKCPAPPLLLDGSVAGILLPAFVFSGETNGDTKATVSLITFPGYDTSLQFVVSTLKTIVTANAATIFRLF